MNDDIAGGLVDEFQRKAVFAPYYVVTCPCALQETFAQHESAQPKDPLKQPKQYVGQGAINRNCRKRASSVNEQRILAA